MLSTAFGETGLVQINADYGGVTGLCAKLQTDANNGLPNDKHELEKRRKVFGRNEIPPNPPKSFLRLAWEALQVQLVVTKLTMVISASFRTLR